MSTKIAITGATGNIGGAVGLALSSAGAELKLVVRDVSRAPKLSGATAIASSGYADSEANRLALDGVELLFMVSAAEAPDRLAQHLAFVDAAVAAGVKHIVYTSFIGASADATFTLARDHWATEQHIKSAGLAYTFLRDNFYLDLLADFADASGVIRGPAADGRVAGVTRSDVAAVASAILLAPGAHMNKSYDLTGPAALTLTEVAQIITESTGKPTRFLNETVPEAYASRAVFQAPPWEVDAWVSTYTAIAAGEMATVTDQVQQLTGKPAMSLREVLRRA